MSAAKALEALQSGPKTAAQLCVLIDVKTSYISRTMGDLVISGRAMRIDGGSGRGSVATYALPGAGLIPATRLAWTDERVATLRRLWTEEGMGASGIAKALGGVTRNSVIGKLDREGLLGPDSPIRRPAKKVRKPKPPAAPRATAPKRPSAPRGPSRPKLHTIIGGNGTVMGVHVDRHPFAPPPRAKAFIALPGTTPLPFGDRPRNGCRWPIDREGDTDGISRLACCAPKAEGFDLCATHFTMGNAQHLTPEEARAKASRAKPVRNMDFFDQSIVRRPAARAA